MPRLGHLVAFAVGVKDSTGNASAIPAMRARARLSRDRSSSFEWASLALTAETPRARGLRRGDSVRKRLAGLEQGLEIAEHPGVSAARALVLARPADDRRQPGRAVQLVGERQRADPVVNLLDLVRDAGDPLLGHRRVHEHVKRRDELARWIGFQDLTGDDHLWELVSLRGAGRLERLGRTHGVRAARAQVVVDQAGVAVALGPLGLGDRVPDRLRRRLDVDPVDLCGRTAVRRGAHAFPSSSVFRSASADTWRSVYLSIHRSWISRIGTGF